MHAANHLRLETNPFTASANGARIGRPLQAALGEVIRQIGLEAPVIVICGSAGSGKTLLIHMIARACTDMGLCARQIDRGDLMQAAIGQSADVLLVDEADSIADSTLHTLVSSGANNSTTTMIFLCLPSNARRFTSSGGRAVIIELASLTRSDARNYLLERATSAGRPDLFEAEALDVLIEGARGSPRVLRSIASLAFFAAAVDGSARIGAKHVADALASQIHCETPKSEQAAFPIASRAEFPIPTPIIPMPIAAAPIIAASIKSPAPAPALAEPPKSVPAAFPVASRVEIPVPTPIIPTLIVAAPIVVAPIKSPAPVSSEIPKSVQAAIPAASRVEIAVPTPIRPTPIVAAPIIVAPIKSPAPVSSETPKSVQAAIPAASRVEIPIPTPIIPAPIIAASIKTLVPAPAPIPAPAPLQAPGPALAVPASDPPLSDGTEWDPPAFMPEIAEARKKFGAARPRSVVWMPRLVGVSAALLASVAIAEGLPSLLFSSIPSNANASNVPPAEVLSVPRLGFASVVPAPVPAPPNEAPKAAAAAKQSADIAKALKNAASSEIKPLASAIPVRKPATDQVQAAKKPAGKDVSAAPDQTKATLEDASRKNALAAREAANRAKALADLQAAKEAADRAATSVAVKELAPSPAPLQTADPAPAPKEVATITEAPKQEEAAPKAFVPQVLAVLPPAAKEKEAADRARAEEIALARGREAVLAKVAADRALAAKQEEERALVAKRAANRESMRALANSLRGVAR